MPTYNGKCFKCEFEFEYTASIASSDETPPCPQCGGESRRAFTPAEGGFILKGEGWHKSGAFMNFKKKEKKND